MREKTHQLRVRCQADVTDVLEVRQSTVTRLSRHMTYPEGSCHSSDEVQRNQFTMLVPDLTRFVYMIMNKHTLMKPHSK